MDALSIPQILRWPTSAVVSLPPCCRGSDVLCVQGKKGLGALILFGYQWKFFQLKFCLEPPYLCSLLPEVGYVSLQIASCSVLNIGRVVYIWGQEFLGCLLPFRFLGPRSRIMV